MIKINIFKDKVDGLQKFEDSRGIIADVFYKKPLEHVALIKSEPNTIRGNHFHKETTQHMLITQGSLEYWFKKIPKEQILIISSEKLQNNTEETLSEVFEFLDISKQDINDLTKQNKIGYPKMKDSTREVLNNFFKPYNEKLFNLLGKTFDWDDQK